MTELESFKTNTRDDHYGVSWNDEMNFKITESHCGMVVRQGGFFQARPSHWSVFLDLLICI